MSEKTYPATVYTTAAQKYLTVDAVAQHLGVSGMTVNRLVHMGAFPNAIRVIKQFRIPIADVKAYEAANRIVGEPYDEESA